MRKYKIHLEGQVSTNFETVEAQNYWTDGGFVTFFITVNDDQINVASYCAGRVLKIESEV